jgi:hypothetical protein
MNKDISMDQLNQALEDLEKQEQITSQTDHPSEEMIVAFAMSDLSANEMDELGEHFTYCSKCLPLLEDAEAFFQLEADDLPEVRDHVLPTFDELIARARKQLGGTDTPIEKPSLSFVEEWRARIARRLQDFERWADVPQYGYAANKDRKYFGERLTIHYDTVDETEQQITLRSTDPAFAYSFLVLGTRNEPLYLALLSDNAAVPNEYSTTLCIGTREEVMIDDGHDAIYSVKDLSERFDCIDAELFERSISAVSPAGLPAWRKAAESLQQSDQLRTTILQHERIARFSRGS